MLSRALVCSDSRSASAMRVASVASCKRQRRRTVVEHRVDEMRDLAQERLLEALVERRRAFVAHAVRVGDVDPVRAADSRRWSAGRRCRRSRSPSRGRAPSCATRRSRPVLPSVELADRHAVVDVAEFAQALVDRDGAGGEHAQRAADCPGTSARGRCRARVQSRKMPPLVGAKRTKKPDGSFMSRFCERTRNGAPIMPAWILS